MLENLGDEVFTMTADRKLLKLAGIKHGDILYDGMSSVAAASTCPEFGYGFRAFPFAERMLGMINVRIYDRSAQAAVANIPKLWRGAHPLRGMHDWFASAVRMTFSRPVPVPNRRATPSGITTDNRASLRRPGGARCSTGEGWGDSEAASDAKRYLSPWGNPAVAALLWMTIDGARPGEPFAQNDAVQERDEAVRVEAGAGVLVPLRQTLRSHLDLRLRVGLLVGHGSDRPFDPAYERCRT